MSNHDALAFPVATVYIQPDKTPVAKETLS
jgi:hypothetical protein